MANLAKRPDGRWRACYRDAVDKEHSRHFASKLDAQRWLDEVTASVVTGQYVAPRPAGVTFETFCAEWAARQVWKATTVLAMTSQRPACPSRAAAPGRAAPVPRQAVDQADDDPWPGARDHPHLRQQRSGGAARGRP